MILASSQLRNLRSLYLRVPYDDIDCERWFETEQDKKENYIRMKKPDWALLAQGWTLEMFPKLISLSICNNDEAFPNIEPLFVFDIPVTDAAVAQVQKELEVG